MPDGVEHPADDVLAALVEDDLDQRLAGLAVDDLERVDLRRPVLELDALAQPLADVPRHRAGDLGEVGLGHAVRRVLQPVGEVAVVGEQQQALGVGVEAADVEEPLVAVADVVAEADPAELVVHRRDHAERLVEGEVDAGLVEVDAHAVDVDDLAGRVDAHAELGDDLAVDLHPAGGDELLADPAGPDAGGGQQLLQPDAVGVVDVDLGSVLLRAAGSAGWAWSSRRTSGRCPSSARSLVRPLPRPPEPTRPGALPPSRAGLCVRWAGVIRVPVRPARRGRPPRAGTARGPGARRACRAPCAPGSTRWCRRGSRRPRPPRRAPR